MYVSGIRKSSYSRLATNLRLVLRILGLRIDPGNVRVDGNWTKDVTSQNHRKRRYQESAVSLTGRNLRSCNGSKLRIWSALGQRLDENGYTEVVSQPLKFFW